MSRKKSHSKELFTNRILNELSLILRKEVSDPRVTFVSLTRIELTDDYSHAKVYWDTFDPSKKDDIAQAMDDRMGKMLRSTLSQKIDVRHTPTITLIYDSQYEDEAHIDLLLKDNGPKS